MTSPLQDLLQQRDALEKAIAQARREQIAAVVLQVRELIAVHGLTVQDVFSGRTGKSGAAKTSAAVKVQAKYRDPASGKTWTGRGKAPKWIEGKDRSAFVIA